MNSYPGRWRTPAAGFVLGILITTGLGATPPEAGIPLSLGDVVEREIAQGETHGYSLDVPAGHFVQVVVEQHGVDVELVLRDVDGEELLHRDSLHGTEGQDRLSTITEASGRLTLEISTGHAEPESHYVLRLAALRPALDTDRALVQAEELSFQAMVASFSGNSWTGKNPERAIQLQQRAVELWSQALPLWRTAGDVQGESETLRWLARTLHRLGMSQYRQGDLLEARNSFLQAVEIRRRIDPPDRPALARTLTNLASVISDLGEYQRALSLLEEARSTWERWGGEHEDRTTTINNLGHTYSRLGDFETAGYFYRQALERNRAEDQPEREAATLHNLAWIAGTLEDHDEALRLSVEALALARELAIGDLEGSILESRGRWFRELGRWTESEEHFVAALKIRQDLDDPRGEAIALHGLGKLQWRRGQLADARRSLERAQEILAPLEHPYFQAWGEMMLARVESGLGAHRNAVDHARSALDQLESLRNEVVRQDLRTTFLAARRQFYDVAVHVAMKAHAHRPGAGFDAAAFASSERARARSFLDSLARADIDPWGAADPELANRERELRGQINALAAADSRSTADAMQEKLLELRRVRGDIARDHPDRALHTQQPLDLDGVRRDVLDPDTLLMAYYLGETSSYLWAVSPARIHSYELPPREEIEALALEAHGLLSTGAARKGSRAWSQVANDLSRLLLAPVARHLRRDRLVVIPDGALHYLPFSALPDPREPESPLLARHEVVHEVSASAVAALRSVVPGPPAPKLLAVFADPVYDVYDPRVSQTRGSNFLRLPGTHAEAQALAELAARDDTWLVTGFEARRDQVLNGPLDEYRILHFATHSKVDEEHPELSGIALSQVDPTGQEIEGFLRLHDLYGLRLRADLVTLAACETALGKRVHGEGLIGLTRGFFHAGAERVLSSLWAVDDRATLELMKRFYGRLLQFEDRPATALRRAQLDLAHGDDHGGPSSWAGFVLQGEWR